MLTGLQIRMARKMLGWAVWRLAVKSRVPISTMMKAEAADEAPLSLIQENQLRRALEAAGIEFTNGDKPGVRLKRVASSEGGASVVGRGRTCLLNFQTGLSHRSFGCSEP